MTRRPLPPAIQIRAATDADVPAMAACRLHDPPTGAADPRMAAYFRGEHHPHCALPPRTGYIALANGLVIGYIAGHLSTRHGCAAEVQYLYVASAFRRQGIARALVQQLALWFQQNHAARVCVCVDADSPAAEPFYQSLGAHPLSPQRKLWYIWDDAAVLLPSAG